MKVSIEPGQVQGDIRMIAAATSPFDKLRVTSGWFARGNIPVDGSR
jgi:hypothetical protein